MMKKLAPFISCFISSIPTTFKDGDYITIGGKILANETLPDVDNNGTQKYILLDDGSDNIRAFIYNKYIKNDNLIKENELVFMSGIVSIFKNLYTNKIETTITGAKIFSLEEAKSSYEKGEKKIDE